MKELGLQQEVDQYEYAKLSLAGQLQNLRPERDHQSRQTSHTFIFIGFVIVVLTLFLVYCLYLGKDKIAEEIIKLLLAFLGGGAGGYALGRNKR